MSAKPALLSISEDFPHHIASGARRRLRLIARDYGHDHDDARLICLLADRQRLTGVSCVTLPPDWHSHAKLLMGLTNPVDMGLHLVLSAHESAPDFPPRETLLRELITGTTGQDDLYEILDRQLRAYFRHVGRFPDFISSHDQIHYLHPVRRWLASRFQHMNAGQRPYLCGAPTLIGAPAWSWGAIAFLRRLSAGFDDEMRRAGFHVMGPVATNTGATRARSSRQLLAQLIRLLPDGAVILCRPGQGKGPNAASVPGEIEARFIGSARFPALLNAVRCELAGSEHHD